jgi:hypothetical protein
MSCITRSSKDEQILESAFYEDPKRRAWKAVESFKIQMLFNGDNSRTVALTQMKFGTAEDLGHTYKFYLNNYYV